MPLGHDRSSETLVASSDGDPLSDVLHAVRLSGALFFLVDAKLPWTAEVPAGELLGPILLPGSQHVISYHLVEEGSCWCSLPGLADVELCAGDVIVIAHGDPYVLSGSPGSDVPTRPSDESIAFFRSCAAGHGPRVVTEGGAGPERISLACGFLGCDRAPFNPLLATLPRILHIRARVTSRGDRLGALFDFALSESRNPDLGSDCVLVKISELMFVEVVRRYLATLPPEQSGWLAALRDPNIGSTLASMHQRPAHGWTLEELARVAGLSRSVFVPRFTQLVGQPPMHYLTQWRMQLAARMLVEGSRLVLSVALEVGYESEAAFSRAFKRALGMPPAAWRRQHEAKITPAPGFVGRRRPRAP